MGRGHPPGGPVPDRLRGVPDLPHHPRDPAQLHQRGHRGDRQLYRDGQLRAAVEGSPVLGLAVAHRLLHHPHGDSQHPAGAGIRPHRGAAEAHPAEHRAGAPVPALRPSGRRRDPDLPLGAERRLRDRELHLRPEDQLVPGSGLGDAIRGVRHHLVDRGVQHAVVHRGAGSHPQGILRGRLPGWRGQRAPRLPLHHVAAGMAGHQPRVRPAAHPAVEDLRPGVPPHQRGAVQPDARRHHVHVPAGVHPSQGRLCLDHCHRAVRHHPDHQSLPRSGCCASRGGE